MRRRVLGRLAVALVLASSLGRRWPLAFLVPGPLLGIVAMQPLRSAA